MAFYVEKIRHPPVFTLKATLKRCWLPRRCSYSNKFLWFRSAYLLETEEYDFEDYYKVYTWVEKETYLIKKLRDEL